MAYRSSLMWQDSQGHERLTILTSAAGAPNVIASLENCSNAWLNFYIDAPLTILGVSTPVAQRYDDVGYMCAIDITDAAGGSSRIFVPAIDTVNLMPDLETLNPGGPNFAALALQATTELVIQPTNLPCSAIGPGWVTRQSSSIRGVWQVAVLPAPPVMRHIVWLDAHGNTISTYLWGDTNVGGTMGLLNLMSNAVVTQYWEGQIQLTAGTFTAAPFQTVMDVAELVFSDTNGNRGTVVIPAPKLALFEADGETINNAQGNITNLAANVAAELIVLGSGLPLSILIGGRRRHYTTRLAI